MITIKCNLCNINQRKYDEIINSLDLNRLQCSLCKTHNFVIHSYYYRKLKTRKGTIYLRIMRIICKDCKTTHALLLSCIVPYSRIDLNSQIRIITNDDVEGLMNEIDEIDDHDINYIRNNFNKYYKERLLSIKVDVSDKNLVFKCFKYFKRQFMQIRCITNILFD